MVITTSNQRNRKRAVVLVFTEYRDDPGWNGAWPASDLPPHTERELEDLRIVRVVLILGVVEVAVRDL